jgi:hypothetical protein
MGRRALPVGLVLAAAFADLHGAHGLAFYLLVASVPATAVSALAFFGDLVEIPGGAAGIAVARVQAALATLGLVLVVIASAARGQSAIAGDVPALGVSALVAGLTVFAAQGLVALAALTRAAEPELEGQLIRGVFGHGDQRLDGEEGADGHGEAGDDRQVQHALSRR